MKCPRPGARAKAARAGVFRFSSSARGHGRRRAWCPIEGRAARSGYRAPVGGSSPGSQRTRAANTNNRTVEESNPRSTPSGFIMSVSGAVLLERSPPGSRRKITRARGKPEPRGGTPFDVAVPGVAGQSFLSHLFATSSRRSSCATVASVIRLIPTRRLSSPFTSACP